MEKPAITDRDKILKLQDKSFRGDDKLKKGAYLFHPLFKNATRNYIKLQLQGRETEEDIKTLIDLTKDEKNYSSKPSPDFKEDFYENGLLEKFEIKYQLKTHIKEKIWRFCYRNIIMEGFKTNPYMLLEEADELYTKVIKEELAQLAKINQKALEAEDEDRFLEDIELPEDCNPENLAHFLKFKFRVHFKRKEYHESIRKLDDYENYLELPDFILNEQSIDLDKGKLYRSYYIEGNSGSGKTTLVQNIAYKLQKYDVYYIDLTDTEKTSSFLDSDIIKPFLVEVAKINEIVIIDNIHHSEDTLAIAKEFLVKAQESHCYIILSSQKFMSIDNKSERTIDKLFEKINVPEIKKKIITIDLSEKEKSTSLILNILNFYNKKENGKFQLYEDVENDLYEKFSGILSYIDLSLANSKNIVELKNTDFEDFIMKKYKVLRSMDSEQEFKILLLYLSANDFQFSLSKDLYENHLIYEREIVNNLLEDVTESQKIKKKNLLFKVIEEDRVVLQFPHNSIAKYILNLICKRRGKNIYELIVENLGQIRIYDARLYEKFFSILYFTVKEDEVLIDIYNNLTNLNIKKVLTIYSLYLIIKSSFSLSIKKYNQVQKSKMDIPIYGDNAENSWDDLRCEGLIIRDLSKQGYQYQSLMQKENFVDLITEENIKNNLSDIIFLTRFDFDKEYDFLMVEIFNILIDSDIILTIEQLITILYNMFTRSLLGQGYDNYEFKHIIMFKLTQKTVDHNFKKNLRLISSFRNMKNTYLHHKQILYKFLKSFNISVETLITIMIELHITYETNSQSKSYKKIIKNIDDIFYNYIDNDILVDDNIKKFYDLDTLLLLIVQSDSDSFLFKKTFKVIQEAFSRKYNL